MKSKPRLRSTDDDMRAAYEREAPHRPHWPSTYDRAIADPMTAAILRLMAAHPASFGRRKPVPVSRQPDPRYWTPAPARPRPREIDFKSRAAGEKPELPDDQ